MISKDDNGSDVLPTIVLEQDDVKSFKQERTQKNHKPVKQANASSSPKFMSLLYLIAFIAIGYFIYQQNLQLKSSQARILTLEQQLSSTDQELGDSAVAIQVKVKALTEKTDELWKQMDKLWASAWRKNQQQIKSLANVVEKNSANQLRFNQKFNGTIDQTSAQVKQIAIDSDRQNKMIRSLQESLLHYDLEISDLKGNLISVASQLNELELRNKALADNLSALTSSLATKPVIKP